jgi:hypothetical protein
MLGCVALAQHSPPAAAPARPNITMFRREFLQVLAAVRRPRLSRNEPVGTTTSRPGSREQASIAQWRPDPGPLVV